MDRLTTVLTTQTEYTSLRSLLTCRHSIGYSHSIARQMGVATYISHRSRTMNRTTAIGNGAHRSRGIGTNIVSFLTCCDHVLFGGNQKVSLQNQSPKSSTTWSTCAMFICSSVCDYYGWIVCELETPYSFLALVLARGPQSDKRVVILIYGQGPARHYSCIAAAIGVQLTKEYHERQTMNNFRTLTFLNNHL